jgi:hypothetical protein
MAPNGWSRAERARERDRLSLLRALAETQNELIATRRELAEARRHPVRWAVRQLAGGQANG